MTGKQDQITVLKFGTLDQFEQALKGAKTTAAAADLEHIEYWLSQIQHFPEFSPKHKPWFRFWVKRNVKMLVREMESDDEPETLHQAAYKWLNDRL